MQDTALRFPAQADVYAASAASANVGSEDDARPYAPGMLLLLLLLPVLAVTQEYKPVKPDTRMLILWPGQPDETVHRQH